MISQSFRFPISRPAARVAISELGITARYHEDVDGCAELLLSAHKFAWGVRIAGANAMPGDNYFGIEPGGTRRIPFSSQPKGLSVTAINAEGRLPIT